MSAGDSKTALKVAFQSEYEKLWCFKKKEIDMLVENQMVEVTINQKTQRHYKDLGYGECACGTTITVKAEDLTRYSTIKVKVICDFCGKEVERPYTSYMRYHNNGDCCVDCQGQKSLKVGIQKYGEGFRGRKFREITMERYGVENCMFRDDIKRKVAETNLERYGAVSVLAIDEYRDDACIKSWSKEAREKRIATNLKRYGVEYPMQNDEIKGKGQITLANNGLIKTSKQQIQLSELLKTMYGNCELNVPCGRCCLDCVVEVDGQKIDVEYDGKYWHKNKQEYDDRRDTYVKTQDYKILRIQGNYNLPSEEEIRDAITLLSTTERTFERLETT